MDQVLIQYTDFNDYLAKHSAKNENLKNSSLPTTHTRIPHPDKSSGIYGGAYIITQEELPTFHALYYNHVFTKKKLEYLTEKQLTLGNGPILLDFDFRYKYDVEARQHTKEHITDLLSQVYLEELKSFFIFTAEQHFQVYVMEKPDVIRLEDKGVTKDGIHIIIGIQMDHIMQQMLRQRVLSKIAEVWGNAEDGEDGLPLTNSYDSVLDEGISKGTTNWQMYGSRKPGNLAYELTQIYDISMDPNDGEFMINELAIDELDLSLNFNKLSAQYEDHPRFEINANIVSEYEKISELKKPKLKKAGSKTKIVLLQEEDEPTYVDIKDIDSAIMLDKAIQYMLTTFTAEEYNLKEVHDYTQILPSQYYEAGSHEKSRLVAFALKNTDERLFLSWIKLRSNASDFNYGEITELYDKWTKYFNKNDKSQTLTYKSILFWARQDAPAEYMKIKEQTLDHFIDETIKEPTEFDFAMILFHMFKDKYTCTSITAKTWYVFNNHCWEQDKGDRLRYSISKEMFALYKNKRDNLTIEATQYETNDPKREALNDKGRKISAIVTKLKKTSDKNNIFREAHEIFYDKNFIDKMDSNKYLMCFSNGVVDFKNRIFRDGLPQDYITKSTKIPYIVEPTKLDTTFNDIKQSVTTFMEQLFPDKSLNEYMWSHLSSVLIGENMNQTFNIYVGSGSNGKSILMDLMAQTLGEYKGTVPITLVTEKRGCIGGTSSEVMQLKGIRYAVMQEPSKNAKINEGPMKELTGGDPLQARGLYKESETFIPQFSLAVCTNTLFDITSNDDGTWRRIRLCNFVSKFVDEIVEDTDELEPVKQFLKDKTLKEKLPIWAPIFASMLVQRAFINQGKVEDCPIVLAASSKYRNSQDYIAAFVADRVVKETGKHIKQKELSEEFKIWFSTNVMRAIPANTITELSEYISKKFGAHKSKVWMGIKIKYDVPENDLVALAYVANV